MAFLFRIAKYVFQQVGITISGQTYTLATESGDTIVIG